MKEMEKLYSSVNQIYILMKKISHKMIPKNKQTMNVLPQRIIQLNVLIKYFLFISHEIFLDDWQNILLSN